MSAAGLEQIADVVRDVTGITLAEMRVNDRSRRVSRIRHMTIWLVRKCCPLVTWGEIGDWIHREHSTCEHSVRVVEQQGLLTWPELGVALVRLQKPSLEGLMQAQEGLAQALRSYDVEEEQR